MWHRSLLFLKIKNVTGELEFRCRYVVLLTIYKFSVIMIVFKPEYIFKNFLYCAHVPQVSPVAKKNGFERQIIFISISKTKLLIFLFGTKCNKVSCLRLLLTRTCTLPAENSMFIIHFRSVNCL